MVGQCGCVGWQGSAHIEGGIKDNHFILRASGLAVLPFPFPSLGLKEVIWCGGKNTAEIPTPQWIALISAS